MANTKKKKKNSTRFKTARNLQKNINRLLDLPIWMRIGGLLFIFNFFRGNRGKTQADRDYEDAIRFLRESQGFTGKR